MNAAAKELPVSYDLSKPQEDREPYVGSVLFFKHVIFTVTLLLILIPTTLSIYLFAQVRSLSRQLDAAGAQGFNHSRQSTIRTPIYIIFIGYRTNRIGLCHPYLFHAERKQSLFSRFSHRSSRRLLPHQYGNHSPGHQANHSQTPSSHCRPPFFLSNTNSYRIPPDTAFRS